MLFSALLRHIFDSSVAPLTEIFTARDQRNEKQNQTRELQPFEGICSADGRGELKCHVDHRGFRPQESSSSRDYRLRLESLIWQSCIQYKRILDMRVN